MFSFPNITIKQYVLGMLSDISRLLAKNFLEVNFHANLSYTLLKGMAICNFEINSLWNEDAYQIYLKVLFLLMNSIKVVDSSTWNLKFEERTSIRGGHSVSYPLNIHILKCIK